MRRFLKAAHEISAMGVMGALATDLVLLATASPTEPVAYAAIRDGIVAINKWVLMPSLLVVLVSGLLAIAATEAYKNAGWAWIKALSGVLVFEATLQAIGGGARRAQELAAAAVAGQPDAEALAAVLRSEWGTLWILVGLSLANVVLAVWRPKLAWKA